MHGFRGLRYPSVMKLLRQDLPEVLSCFAFPRHLGRKLRTSNVIARCFVELRRRTQPHGVLRGGKARTASPTPSPRDPTCNGKPAP